MAAGDIHAVRPADKKPREGLFFVWAGQGSNLRPLLCQSSALTN